MNMANERKREREGEGAGEGESWKMAFIHTHLLFFTYWKHLQRRSKKKKTLRERKKWSRQMCVEQKLSNSQYGTPKSLAIKSMTNSKMLICRSMTSHVRFSIFSYQSINNQGAYEEKGRGEMRRGLLARREEEKKKQKKRVFRKRTRENKKRRVNKETETRERVRKGVCEKTTARKSRQRKIRTQLEKTKVRHLRQRKGIITGSVWKKKNKKKTFWKRRTAKRWPRRTTGKLLIGDYDWNKTKWRKIVYILF